MKKKMRLIYLVVLLITIICFVTAGFLVKDLVGDMGFTSQTPDTPAIDETAVVLYREPKNPTELQKSIYKELTEISKTVAQEETLTEESAFGMASAVVKSFIADFYTWTNKDGNFDVGGLDYVYGPNHLAFAMVARDSFYQNLNFFEKEYGIENLIEVESIKIRNVSYAEDVVMNEKTYKAYYVEALWKYKENDVFDVSGFQDRAYYIVMHNEETGRFEIAGTFEITWEVSEDE